MPDRSITFAIDGDVSLDVLHQAVKEWRTLVAALEAEVAPGTEITWIVEDLRGGSASATIVGSSSSPEAVGPVVTAYLAVGKALEHGNPIHYSSRVTRPARALAALVSPERPSIRFETAEDVATITAAGTAPAQPRPVGALGAIEGRVQTLTSRDGLRFSLYDAIHDRAVTCYVPEDRQELLRDIWNRRAIVHGWVIRDTVTGRPVSVSQVRAIEPLRDVPRGSYIRARGVVTPLVDAPPPGETIRRMRDAQ